MTGVDSPPTIDAGLRGRLLAYRIAAYVVGVFLLLLTLVAMPLKYIWHVDAMVAIVGQVHGFGYMVYLAIAFELARRARWSILSTLLVLLAGTIPFLSFVAERKVTRKVNAGERI